MKQCTNCGGTGHTAPHCPWNKANGCPTCGKRGKQECGRVECGNRVQLTANYEVADYEARRALREADE